MNGKKSKPVSLEHSEIKVHPWRRLFARLIDVYLFSIVIGLILGIFFPIIFKLNDLILGLIILFLWIFVEAILMSTFGTTLGKLLFNIKVRDLNGNKLNFKSALKRSFLVWSVGLAAGIPVIYLFSVFFSYRQLKNTGTTFWDKNQFIVSHGTLGYIRWPLIVLILLLGAAEIVWDKYQIYQLGQQFTPTYYQRMVESINRELPYMIDNETELTNMTYEVNTLGYHYRLVNKMRSDLEVPLFQQQMRAQLLSLACDVNSPTPGLGQMLSHGTTLKFDYADKTGVPITEVVLNPDECK